GRRVSLICSTMLLCCSLSTTAPASEVYALSLHDALPISRIGRLSRGPREPTLYGRPLRCLEMRGCSVLPKYVSSAKPNSRAFPRSEEHTSELQSPYDLVCRLLLEKKKHRTKCRTREQQQD